LSKRNRASPKKEIKNPKEETKSGNGQTHQKFQTIKDIFDHFEIA
jgi:hypothetical protein